MEEAKKPEVIESKTYKCESCGSHLTYDPVLKKLKCPHCGFEKDIVKPKPAMELKYDESSELNYESWGEVKSYKCDSCGAITVLEENQTATVCPFCGAPIVVRSSELPGIKPNAILPFSVPEQKAMETYKKWIRRRYLAPQSLKKKAEKVGVKGIYIPLFTFDTSTYSTYTIRYGRHYTVTVGSGKNRRTVVKTRWYNDSGSIREDFDDIQVEASSHVQQKDISKINEFDTEKSVSYHTQYIAGYSAERYSTGLDDCWDLARNIARDKIRQKILNEYTYDVLDYVNIISDYSNTTFKYVLVPIWSIAYKYKKQVYGCIVNGRKEGITGTYPKSALKIGTLVTLGLGVVATIAYFLIKYFVL